MAKSEWIIEYQHKNYPEYYVTLSKRMSGSALEYLYDGQHGDGGRFRIGYNESEYNYIHGNYNIIDMNTELVAELPEYIKA